MSIRPRLKKYQKTRPVTTATSYRLTPVATSATRSTRRREPEALLLMPNGVKFTQNPALPQLPGQVGLRGDRPVDIEDFASFTQERERPVSPPENGYFDSVDLAPLSPSKHRLKRLRQWERWTTEILPKSVPAYLELQRSTELLRKEAMVDVQGQACRCCPSPRKLKIWVIRFSSAFSISKSYVSLTQGFMSQGSSR